MYTKQTSIISAALKPDELVKLAPYKLAFVIAKSKIPFSSCHAFVEFAKLLIPTLSYSAECLEAGIQSQEEPTISIRQF